MDGQLHLQTALALIKWRLLSLHDGYSAALFSSLFCFLLYFSRGSPFNFVSFSLAPCSISFLSCWLPVQFPFFLSGSLFNFLLSRWFFFYTSFTAAQAGIDWVPARQESSDYDNTIAGFPLAKSELHLSPSLQGVSLHSKILWKAANKVVANSTILASCQPGVAWAFMLCAELRRSSGSARLSRFMIRRDKLLSIREDCSSLKRAAFEQGALFKRK